MERSYGVGARCMNFYNEKKKKKVTLKYVFYLLGTRA